MLKRLTADSAAHPIVPAENLMNLSLNPRSYLDGTWYVDTNGNGEWDGTPADNGYSLGSRLTGAVPNSALVG